MANAPSNAASARELLEELRVSGIVLKAIGDDLYVSSPESQVDKQTLLRIKRYKAVFLAILHDQKLANKSRSRLTPQKRTHVTPLSFQQREWWEDELLGPTLTTDCNIQVCVRVTGPLDIAALSYAIDTLVWRHENLRTVLRYVGGQPMQVVEEPGKGRLRVSHVPAVDADKHLMLLISLANIEMAAIAGVMSSELLRTTVCVFGKEDAVFILTAHHIIIDGLSIDIFFRELMDIYLARKIGTFDTPEIGRLQYGDYTVWQKNFFSGIELNRRVRFWRQLLDNAPLERSLSRRAYHGIGNPPRGKEINLEFGDLALVKDVLQNIAIEHSATLNMVIASVFVLFLSYWLNSRDVIVGNVDGHRLLKNTSSMIGLFQEMQVLRISLADSPKFPSVLARVREAWLDAYSFGLPFSLLKSEAIARTLPRAAIHFRTDHSGLPDGGGWGPLNIEVIDISDCRDTPTAWTDVQLVVYTGGSLVRSKFVFDEELFSSEDRHLFASEFGGLLRSVCDQKNEQITRMLS